MSSDPKPLAPVTEETWRTRLGMINTLIKNSKVQDSSGSNAFRTLAAPMVLPTEYHGLNAAATRAHDANDAAILAAISKCLSAKDQDFLTQFAANTLLDDPTLQVQNPGVQPWCRSPGRAALDFLNSKFSTHQGVDPEALDDLQDEMEAVSISEHRSDFTAFEADLEIKWENYRSAGVAANPPRLIEHMESSLVRHLFKHFQAEAEATFGTVLSVQRHRQGVTYQSLMRVLRKEWKKKGGKLLAEAKTKTRVLQVQAPPVSEAPPTWALALVAGINKMSSKKVEPPKRKQSPEDAALYQKCLAQGICFQNVKKRCRWGAKCKFTHDETITNATTIEVDAGVSLFVTLVDDSAAVHQDPAPSSTRRRRETKEPEDDRGHEDAHSRAPTSSTKRHFSSSSSVHVPSDHLTSQDGVVHVRSDDRDPLGGLDPSDLPSLVNSYFPSVCPLVGDGGLVGVFSDCRDVQAPTILGMYDGVMLYDDEFHAVYPDPSTAKYVMEVADGVWVDASSPVFANWTRDLLHVAEPPLGSGPDVPAPNCAFISQDGVVYVVAIRAIARYEQLSVDYGPTFVFPPEDPALSPLPPRAGAAPRAPSLTALRPRQRSSSSSSVPSARLLPWLSACEAGKRPHKRRRVNSSSSRDFVQEQHFEPVKANHVDEVVCNAHCECDKCTTVAVCLDASGHPHVDTLVTDTRQRGRRRLREPRFPKNKKRRAARGARHIAGLMRGYLSDAEVNLNRIVLYVQNDALTYAPTRLYQRWLFGRVAVAEVVNRLVRRDLERERSGHQCWKRRRSAAPGPRAVPTCTEPLYTATTTPRTPHWRVGTLETPVDTTKLLEQHLFRRMHMYPALGGGAGFVVLATTHPSRSAAPAFVDGQLFVVDTGANGVVLGSSGIAAFGPLATFVPVTNTFMRSNAHKDEIVGRGSLRATVTADDGAAVALNLNVIVSPSSRFNILPPNLIPGFQSASISSSGTISITLLGHPPVTTTAHKGLQVLRLLPCSRVSVVAAKIPPLSMSAPPPPMLVRLHEQLAHSAPSTIHRLIRSGVIAIADPVIKEQILRCDTINCLHCGVSSHPSRPISTVGHEPSSDLKGLFSADFFGPLTKSAGGAIFASVVVSQEFGTVFFGAHKWKSFTEYFAREHEQIASLCGPIKMFRTDGGGEFCNSTMAALLESIGAKHQTTAPGSSFQNGKAERTIRTLRAKAGASLSRSGLPLSFWAEALAWATYVHNRLPTSNGPSPYERMFGTPPTLKFIQPFGCFTLARRQRKGKSNFTSASLPAICLSPDLTTKDSYKILHLNTNTVAHSRNCLFFPDIFPFNKKSLPARSPLSNFKDDDDDANNDVDDEVGTPVPATSGLYQSQNPYAALDMQESKEDSVALNKPSRIISAPASLYNPAAYEEQRRFDRERSIIANSITLSDEPSSLAEALETRDSEAWKAAIRSELTSLKENNTWTAMAVPKGRAAIPTRLVLKNKLQSDGTVERRKARLVAKGFKQRHELDYDSTFAPTLRFTSFRLLCALSLHHDHELHQMDVSTAFLVPELDTVIYVKLPEYHLLHKHFPDLCPLGSDTVKLNKALYGLKQSPRLWYQHLSKTLNKMGFTQSVADPCLWLKVVEGKLVSAIATFVDDCAISASSSDIQAIKDALRSYYKMTDGGPISWFLGVRLRRTNNSLALDQSPNIIKILEAYGCSSCSTVSTPADGQLAKTTASITQEETLFMRDKNYRALVGSLLYLLFTRPDITFAVNQLTRHLSDPRPHHWTAAIRVLKYLQGTKSFALVFTKTSEPIPITGYSDADWAGDTKTRRSTTGYVFTIGGTAFSWRTKLQPSVALSTCEAELMALSATLQEAIWLRQLSADLHIPDSSAPMTLFEDNQGAIALAHDRRFSERSKHIDIKHFFIQEQIAIGNFLVEYCQTGNMLADIFTKGLPRILFQRLRALLGLQEFNDL